MLPQPGRRRTNPILSRIPSMAVSQQFELSVVTQMRGAPTLIAVAPEALRWTTLAANPRPTFLVLDRGNGRHRGLRNRPSRQAKRYRIATIPQDIF
jgi:hypothetical protein